jgi:protein TonB
MEYKKHPEKQPHKRSQQAFFIGLVVALSITLVAFEWKTYTLVIPDSYDPPENLYEEEEETPVVILENKEIPKPPQPKVQKQLPAVVLDPTPKVVFQVVPSTKETEIILGDDLFPPEELEAETQLPTRFPSIQAEFNGGESALYQ